MPIPSLFSLILQQTKQEFVDFGIGICRAIGVPVTSWQPGDPSRSQIMLESTIAAEREPMISGYIQSGFIEYAEGDWHTICAKQFFNVDVPEATYATTELVLTNNGGGVYEEIAPNDLSFVNTVTGKKYHNTTGGDLLAGPGTTLTLTIEADEPGSDSSAGAGEIDDFNGQGLDGVEVSNATAAIGFDKQSKATTNLQCSDKLESLSPDGPSGAYAFVARNRDLTENAAVTRVRAISSSDSGDVTIYIATPSGAVTGPDRDKVEAAIVRWATPLCVTPTVISASNVVIDVTYEIWVYSSVNKTEAEVKAAILRSLQALIADRPVGGDIIEPAETGAIYSSLVLSAIRASFPQIFKATLSAPSDVALANNQVAALGTVTGTVHFVRDPQ